MDSLSQEKMGNFTFGIPSALTEQKAIADFLDSASARFDAAGKLIKGEIDTLKAYKKSLIYEAVTKGLDAGSELKDSGVDWIGEIPVGWSSERLKDFVKFQTGGTPKESIGVNQDNEGQKWFKPADFDDNSIRLDEAENYITDEIIKDTKINLYPENTVLLVGIASIGKIGFSSDKSYSNQQITALLNNEKISSKFLAYVMSAMSGYIKDTALYTVVPIVNNQYLSTLNIPFPSALTEQQKIADYLNEKTKQVDDIIKIKEAQLSNLTKQRKSLIYDVVTGKRKIYG